MNDYLTLLRQRPQFRYLWFASVVSLMGDWFNTIAIVILVNRYTDSGVAVGALFLARALPPFLFGPVAGVAADRFSRKTILVATDVSRAFIVLGFLLVDSPQSAWLIYVLTVVQFTISAFFEPAKSAIIPGLVQGKNELLTANTLSSATWSAMLAFGAAIGGVTAALFGANAALVIDAATFLLSALLVLKIKTVVRPESIVEPSSGWTEFVDGLKYVIGRSDIALLALVKAMSQIGSADILITVYAERIFPIGEDGALALGLMFASAGVGAILGPVLGNWLGDSSARYLQQAIGAGFVLIPLGWLLFGWAPAFPVVLVGLTLRFMGGSLNWTYSSVLLQMKVPDKFLGRVFSFDFGIFTLALSLSVWFTGVALDQPAMSPRQIPLALAAAGLIPLVAWFALNREYYHRIPVAPTEENAGIGSD